MFLRYYSRYTYRRLRDYTSECTFRFSQNQFFYGEWSSYSEELYGKKNSASSTIATRLTFDVSILVRSEFSFGGLVRSPEITTAVHRMICTGYTNSIPGTTTVVCGFSPLPWALLCPSTSVVSANRDARGSYVSGCLVHY